MANRAPDAIINEVANEVYLCVESTEFNTIKIMMPAAGGIHMCFSLG